MAEQDWSYERHGECACCLSLYTIKQNVKGADFEQLSREHLIDLLTTVRVVSGGEEPTPATQEEHSE